MKIDRSDEERSAFEAESRTAHFARLTKPETERIINNPNTSPIERIDLRASLMNPILLTNPGIRSRNFIVKGFHGNNKFYFSNPKVTISKTTHLPDYVRKAKDILPHCTKEEQNLIELLIDQQIPAPIEVVASHLNLMEGELMKLIEKINSRRLFPIMVTFRNGHLLLTETNGNPEVVFNTESISRMIKSKTEAVMEEVEDTPKLKLIPRNLYPQIIDTLTKKIDTSDPESGEIERAVESLKTNGKTAERLRDQLDEIIEIALGRFFRVTPDTDVNRKFSDMDIIDPNFANMRVLWETIARAQDELGYVPKSLVNKYGDTKIKKFNVTLNTNHLELKFFPEADCYVLIKKATPKENGQTAQTINTALESVLISRDPTGIKPFIKRVLRNSRNQEAKANNGITKADLGTLITFLEDLTINEDTEAYRMVEKMIERIRRIMNTDLDKLVIEAIEENEKTPSCPGRTGRRRG